MTDHPRDLSSNNLATQPLRTALHLANNTLLVKRFSIIGPLGNGAHGNVYHAYDQLLETDVAIKVVETSLEDPSQLEIIRNEVVIARQLQHKNIIRIYDVFEDHGLVFFTMELIPGSALVKRLENPITQDQYNAWTGQLFDALSACEASQIKHGDIKPDNILIDQHNNLILIDFGIGQHHGDELQTSGHRDFSAPEVIYSGKSSLQSELYSAGKIAQLMLAHVEVNHLSLSQRWWQLKHQKFASLLCHPNKDSRPTLTQANDFYHQRQALPQRGYRILLLGLVAVICLLVVLWKNMPRTDAELLPEGTIQLGMVYDANSTLLSGLTELVELPMQSNPQLSIINGYKIQDTAKNLGLKPVSNSEDRITLATLFSLDAMIILSLNGIQSDNFLIRASMYSMPANISISELSRSINANTLEGDLTEFASALFIQLADELSQPIDQSDADAFLSTLKTLTAKRYSEDQTSTLAQSYDLTQHAPMYPGAWYQAASRAWEQGDIQTAQENLETLFSLQSNSPFWMLSGRLLQAEMTDDLDLALQSIQKLNEGYPQRPSLLAKRAEIYEWANEMDLAIADYEKALALSQNNAQLWFQLARLKILSGQTRSAIENELTRALIIHRENKNIEGEILVLNAFGVAYLRLAEYETAEKYLKDALALLDPQKFPLERVKSLANLANVDALNGKFSEAKAALEEAIQLLEVVGDSTRLAHVIDTLGFLYEEQGLYEQALSYYKRGLDIRNSDGGSNEQAQSMSNVAFMHFLIGDFSLADIYWQQAKTLFDRNNEQLHLQRTLQNLAQLSLAKGDHLIAIRHLTQVSEQLGASQKQEQMINALLFSFLNFAEGALTSAFDNLALAKQLAQDTGDDRALTEITLWHAEICLKINDLNCQKSQIEFAQNTISEAMIEQKALLDWLMFSYNTESSEITSTEPVAFVENIKTANIPVITEMKILLDIQERLALPLSSQTMQRLDEIVKPIFYQQYMNLLYLKRSQPKAQDLLLEQLIMHPNYWRNHLYYRVFDDPKSQAKGQLLLQEWLNQLTEEQANSYRERYLEL